MTTQFFVPGKPQGKARPRMTRQGHTYTPQSTREYERAIREAFRAEAGDGAMLPEDVPVRLSIEVYYPIPASATKAQRQAMAANLTPCDRKPDLDNVIKAVADALNGVAYEDDRQITTLRARRRWHTIPGLVITVGEDKR